MLTLAASSPLMVMLDGVFQTMVPLDKQAEYLSTDDEHTAFAELTATAQQLYDQCGLDPTDDAKPAINTLVMQLLQRVSDSGLGGNVLATEVACDAISMSTLKAPLIMALPCSVDVSKFAINALNVFHGHSFAVTSALVCLQAVLSDQLLTMPHVSNISHFLDSGGIDMLEACLQDYSDNMGVVSMAIAVANRLALLPDAALALASANFVQAAFTAGKPFESNEFAVKILYSCMGLLAEAGSVHPDILARILEVDGLLEHAVTVLNVYRDDVSVIACITTCFTALAGLPVALRQIVEFGGAEALVAAAHANMHDFVPVHDCFNLLAVLASAGSDSTQVFNRIDADAVLATATANMRAESDNPKIVTVVQPVQLLVTSAATAAKVVESGFVSAAILVWERQPDNYNVVAACAFVIARVTLLLPEPNDEILVSMPALIMAALSKFVDTDLDEDFAMVMANTLFTLCVRVEARAIVFTNDSCVQLLVALLRKFSSSADVLEGCCNLLDIACGVPELLPQLTQSGYWRVLIHALQSNAADASDTPLALVCVSSLLGMARVSELAAAMVADGVLPVLLTTLNTHCGSLPIAFMSVTLLVTLCGDSVANANTCVEGNGIPCVVSVMRAHPHEGDLQERSVVLLVRWLLKTTLLDTDRVAGHLVEAARAVFTAVLNFPDNESIAGMYGFIRELFEDPDEGRVEVRDGVVSLVYILANGGSAGDDDDGQEQQQRDGGGENDDDDQEE